MDLNQLIELVNDHSKEMLIVFGIIFMLGSFRDKVLTIIALLLVIGFSG